MDWSGVSRFMDKNSNKEWLELIVPHLMLHEMGGRFVITGIAQPRLVYFVSNYACTLQYENETWNLTYACTKYKAYIATRCIFLSQVHIWQVTCKNQATNCVSGCYTDTCAAFRWNFGSSLAIPLYLSCYCISFTFHFQCHWKKDILFNCFMYRCR